MAKTCAPPTCRLSSRESPRAMTRPWSMTTMSSASRSASSRYWVVSRSVAPVLHQRLEDVPELVAGPRVQAGGGLVEEEHLRPGDEGRRQVEAAPHPARVGLDQAPAGVRQRELLQQLVGARLRDGAAEVVELADHDQVLAAREQRIDRRVLPGEAEQLARGLRLGQDVDPRHVGRAGVGDAEGGEDAHGRCLARAVGPEQPADRAAGDLEAHPVEGDLLAEAFDEALDLDGMRRHDPPRGRCAAPRRRRRGQSRRPPTDLQRW